MRIIFVALLTLSPLFAISEKTETMTADFTQTIVNEKKGTITYKGTMSAKRPNMAIWHYREPIDKTVYITAENVTVVEPELEQAIVRTLDETIDILAILASARKTGKESYTALYKSKEYNITMQKEMIKAISFTDAFDNIVTIVFTGQLVNHKISDSEFNAVIPADFDIIKD